MACLYDQAQLKWNPNSFHPPDIRCPHTSRSTVDENMMTDFLAEVDDELGIRHPVCYYASNDCNGGADTTNHAAGSVPDISNLDISAE